MQKSNTQFLESSESLESAFQEFNVHADQLAETYRDLQQQIQVLNQELIEERSKHNQQLAEKERYYNRLSQLLSALPAGVVVLDNRGRIQQCNPAAIDLLKEPLCGELWRDVITRAFEPHSHAGQEAHLRDGRTVSISTCPLGDEPGQIILLMDVTETRFLQQSLERHQRLSALGEMSAKLAHQVRTPLASALLYISNLSKGNLRDEEREKFISKALSRLQHLENVVEDMLSYSRVGDSGNDLVSVHDLVDELQQAMELHFQKAKCQFQVELEQEQIYLNGNRDALLGILQNLLNNAIQACSKNGNVSLSVNHTAQTQGLPHVDLIVKDNGCGIAQENIERIFEPFFTTRSEGTGLGLAVAKAVIENHGGTIWIEDSSKDGTTFMIRLPIVKAANYASKFV